MMKKYIAPIVMLFSIQTFYCIGQVDLKTFSSRKMHKDLKVLLETFEAHPDPYTKISEEEFNILVKEVESKFSGDLDEIDYYKELSRLTASIKDGHTSLYMPRTWLEKKRKEYGAFPYEVYLTNDNELYIISSFVEDGLALGSQILQVNGLDINEFVDSLTPFVSHELPNFRNAQISESFEFMLYLAFKQAHNLTFKVKELEVRDVVIPSMPYKQWKTFQKDNEEEKEKKIKLGEPYDFNIIAPGIAKLDVYSFSTYSLTNYELFLRSSFKKIRSENVHSLIIDVRGNYGGWPKIASKLFHYIYNGHFKTMAKSQLKVSYPYRRFFTDRSPDLKYANVRFGQQRRHFVDIEAILKDKYGSMKEEVGFFNESPDHKEYEFLGDCYLLIDRKSFSASSSFASTFQCYSMGYIVGEPTGGTKIFRANNMYKELPKSGFGLSIATTKMYTACYNEEDEPVIPNIEVVPSILDRVHGSDSQLNTVMRLIKKMQQEK